MSDTRSRHDESHTGSLVVDRCLINKDQTLFCPSGVFLRLVDVLIRVGQQVYCKKRYRSKRKYLLRPVTKCKTVFEQ